MTQIAYVHSNEGIHESSITFENGVHTTVPPNISRVVRHLASRNKDKSDTSDEIYRIDQRYRIGIIRTIRSNCRTVPSRERTHPNLTEFDGLTD
jgi:hypothetical protein